MKRSAAAFAVILIFLAAFFPAAVFAASASLSLRANAEQVQAGDTVTVSISFRSDEPVSMVSALISYDHTRLKYVSGANKDVQLSGGTGAIDAVGGEHSYDFEYSLTFLAYAEGTAYFRLRNCEALAFEGGRNLLDESTSMVSIIVGKSSGDPQEPSSTFTPPETADPSAGASAPVSAEPSASDAQPSPSASYPSTLSTDGSLYSVIDDMSLERIMQKTVCVYNGESYPAWRGSSTYILLAGPQGHRFLFDTGSEELVPVIAYTGSQALIPASEPPDAYPDAESTALTINGCGAEAYPAGKEGFYLVWCTDASGRSSWYFYDSADGSFQLARISMDTQTPAPPSQSDSAETAAASGGPDITLYALIAVGVLIVGLSAALIVLAVKGR